MKKLLSKARSTLQDPHASSSPTPRQRQAQVNQSFPSTDQPSTISPPTPIDVIRYRYHHGTNLGSIFCLEQWLSPSMFPPNSSGYSPELSAVKASIALVGLSQTKAKWESHWASPLSDEDCSWLVNDSHCTSIRLPIGYYCLGAKFCTGTPFQDVADVYDGAWDSIKALVKKTRHWGIGVLLDVHALPGGANGDAHGGSASGKSEFWRRQKHREMANRAMVFIAQEIKAGMDGVIGLQVVNEASWGAEGMFAWYEEVLKRIEDVDRSLPVYLSDAWDLGRCLDWVNKRKFGNPVVVDTHKYYTFSDADRNQAPKQIIERLPGELVELDGMEGNSTGRGGAQIIIGEYSCVLDERTWGKVRPQERESYVRQFGRAQSLRWQQRAGGAYFWTFQEGMGEWSFAEQTKNGNIAAPPSLLISNAEVRKRSLEAQNKRPELATDAKRRHEDYWNKSSPGQRFEHERYSDGWQVGFSDALIFFMMRADSGLGVKSGNGGDRIGCLEIWVKKRLAESGQGGPFVWEWEQGLRAGIASFHHVVGLGE